MLKAKYRRHSGTVGRAAISILASGGNFVELACSPCFPRALQFNPTSQRSWVSTLIGLYKLANALGVDKKMR